MDILDRALLEAAKNLDPADFERLVAELATWYIEDRDGWLARVERVRSRVGI